MQQCQAEPVEGVVPVVNARHSRWHHVFILQKCKGGFVITKNDSMRGGRIIQHPYVLQVQFIKFESLMLVRNYILYNSLSSPVKLFSLFGSLL